MNNRFAKRLIQKLHYFNMNNINDIREILTQIITSLQPTEAVALLMSLGLQKNK